MKRREFLGLLGGAAICAFAVHPAAGAPVAGKVARIGVLGTAPWPPFEGLREGLRELGYVEGKNVTFEYRWNGGRNDLYPSLAAELVALPVDVIVAIATPAILAARNATATIPIVMAPIADPIKAGLVSNLARPGGMLTGFSNLAADLVGKRLELLKGLVPSLSAVGVLANTTNPYTDFELEHLQPAAAALRISLDVVQATNDEQLDRALRGFRSKRPGGVFVINDQFFLSRHAHVASFMMESRMPSVYGYREFVDAGGLSYYGANYRFEFRQMAEYVDRILNGTKPGDLPVQMVTRFELVINQKTATALGLTIPSMLLALADEVIE